MKKLIFFLFGLVSYKTFLLAFLYAIGFVANLFVPKSIDGTSNDLTTGAVVIDAALLTLFAVQHSVMARPGFKTWIRKFIHPTIERSFFVLLSSLILLLLFWQWRSIDLVVWSTSGLASVLIRSFYFLGWVIVLLATFMINHFDLFGLKQVMDQWREKQKKADSFKVTWLYSVVRHPIMLGFLIAFWAAPVMTVGHLLFSVATTAYILVAVKFFEERDLLREHGQNYVDYKQKVPMLIPFTKKWK